MGSIFKSFGLKRLVASLLNVIAGVLILIPGTGEALTIINSIAAFFGITGVGQAAVVGTLTKKLLATASSALAVLIGLTYVPGLHLEPYRHVLQEIAAYLGSAAVGAQAVRATEIVVPKQTGKATV